MDMRRETSTAGLVRTYGRVMAGVKDDLLFKSVDRLEYILLSTI